MPETYSAFQRGRSKELESLLHKEIKKIFETGMFNVIKTPYHTQK